MERKRKGMNGNKRKESIGDRIVAEKKADASEEKKECNR